MQYRELGPLKVSIVGFGGWPIGGDSYGWVARRNALAVLARASDLGVNFIDTSNIYGRGRSESIIETYITGRREQFVLATKGGYIKYPEKLQDFSRAHLARSLEGSLRRLSTDYVDIYFLHSPPRELIESEEVFETLEEFRRAGKIRLRGVSVREPEDAALLLTKCANSDVIQVPFNLIDQRAKRIGVLARAKECRISIIARSPLCSGFLARRSTAEFGNLDHRARRPRAELEGWIRAAEKYKFLEVAGARTMAQAALQFCNATEGVTAVIPGMKTLQQVEENIASLYVSPLAGDELSCIEEVEKGIHRFE